MTTGIVPSQPDTAPQEVRTRAIGPRNAGGAHAINTSTGERWVSILSGGAVALYGISKATTRGMALALVGGALVYRGVTGHSMLYERIGIDTAATRGGTSSTQQNSMQFAKSVTIDRPAAGLYAYWRDFSHLPVFMRHLDAVTTSGKGRSHWVARIPANNRVEWDAEITEDKRNEVIKWRSLPEARIRNDGEVRFIAAPGGRGTEVHVTIRYEVPGGIAGKTLAKLTNAIPAQQVKEDIRRFKELMESGEIATTEGQPTGR